MIKVGNDPLVGRIIWSILPAQGGLPTAGSQGDVQMAFKYLRGQRCHNLPGQLLPVLSYPHSKNVFPSVWTKPPVLVCAHYLWSCHWATENKVLPSSLHPPFRYLVTLMRSSVSLHFSHLAEQPHLSQPFLVWEILQCLQPYNQR